MSRKHKPTTDRDISPDSLDFLLPMFWPLSETLAALEVSRQYFKALGGASAGRAPVAPVWHTENRVRLDLPTMYLREFGTPDGTLPVLIDAPYAAHRATIADFCEDHSLVEALLKAGIPAVWVTDWKSSAPEMRFFSIDSYLAELSVAIDDLGGRVHLIGLCQGGWLSAMLAARFPDKVASLVLVGAPIDTGAGGSPVQQLAEGMPMSSFERIVAAGQGRMLGSFLMSGWRSIYPGGRYLEQALTLFDGLEGETRDMHLRRFEDWFEDMVDLPGTYYLQVIQQLFKENRLATGRFVGLGRRLDLKDVTCPTYLLAGASDEIAVSDQVFAARALLGTPADQIRTALIPGGHLDLFMGRDSIARIWPEIGAWIRAQG
ncbi:alpha/beta fold hydrolase [Paracoccus marinaquae]|uniref:Alpha/beta fold hydrolase n=1 Tax=Paracoccus marinaquae TaxID=2841926 RepID=A0ABS6AH27_9RHOB|nr:alpha/beta fold hydrolase [Paracoccus marinaquae]MBU3029242.1 alpha/beta fold hydrolase [Paracoccus marinaquae]